MTTSNHQNTQTLELIGNQQLIIQRKSSENVLKIIDSEGEIQVSIQITSAGPVLRLHGSGLMIQASGPLSIEGEQVAIHGRDGVSITSGGDAQVLVKGDLNTAARIQNITATRGNVNVRANDDVKLLAERIRLNC